MPIYRGSGGSGNSSTSANANQVAVDAAAAAQSATDSANSATASSGSATDSANSATDSANSATASSGSATDSSNSAVASANSATDSANSATASATSASASSTSATLADGSALVSSDYATLSANSATASASSATASANSATASANSATASSGSATDSANSATDSANSATASANSATASSSSATDSANSATASANSATASAASAAAAQASQEAIDGLYLGAQASDPTLDLNGDPVTVGDWYFNTTIALSKIYTGSSWEVLTATGSVTSVTGTGTVSGLTLTGTVTASGDLTLGGTLSGITASQLNSQNISQWTNDSGYTTNTGTVTPSSIDTFTNKSGNISQWTNDSGYLTSYTEADTLNSVTGRGATTTNAVTVGVLTFNGGSSTNHLSFPDDKEVKFGTNALRLYHDGSYSRITDNSSNPLLISGNGVWLHDYSTGENYLRGIPNGTVQLYYDGAAKIKTTSTGVDVTGRIDLDNANVQLKQASTQLRVQTPSGWAGFGPQNTSYCHITTDRSKFYMSEPLHVNGTLSVYNNATANSTNWTAAYNYSQVGHLPLTGGTVTSNLNVNGVFRTDEVRCRTGQQLVLNAGESAGQATGQTGELVYANAEGGLQVNSSPNNWSGGWSGRNTASICKNNGQSNFPAQINVTGNGNSSQWNSAYSATNAATSVFTGNTIAKRDSGGSCKFRDLWADRNDGTGVIYFNNTGGRYLYYTGSVYQFKSAPVQATTGNSQFAGLIVSGTIDANGAIVGRTNTATTIQASNDTGSMSIRGNTTKPAAISFHRAGAYAVNFGLEGTTMKLGGWSAGGIKFNWEMGTGNFTATGNITAYYSDERLKDVVGKIDTPLEKIKAIDTFYYTPNEKARELGYTSTEREVGVSAQSVQAVMPEVTKRAPVDDDGKGGSLSGEDYLTVQYERLVPLLIESIKTLAEQVEDLQEQINAIQ